MPEGDSIHRLAARLAPLLVGASRVVTAFTARRIADDAARSVIGHAVVSVEARGKNLLVHFDQGTVLHVHLRMNGRISVERPRSAFWAPRSTTITPDLRIVVAGSPPIVGRDLPICRLLSTRAAERDLSQLGPDLVDAAFDEDEAVRRLRSLANREIGDALMLQRAIAGIGNVYKSEVLFLEAIDPRIRMSKLDDDRLRAVLRRASALLRRNLGKGRRTTRNALAGPRLWVYGRAGRPCLRCTTPIERYRQGEGPGRSTYACPKCQAPATGSVS